MADLDLGIDDAHSGHFLDPEEFGTSATQRRRRGLALGVAGSALAAPIKLVSSQSFSQTHSVYT